MPGIKGLVVLALTCANVAQSQLFLGPAKSFGTIAGSQLINTGTTWVGGDIGTWPGTSITGYPPGTLTGTINPGTSLAQTAEKYCAKAYNQGWTLSPTVALPSPNLSGLVLPPGVYTFPAPNVVLNAATGLTLDGASNPNGQFVFLIKGTFTTGVNSFIQTVNGAQACNVYFIVAQNAGVGDGTRFNGNILAIDTIKVGKGASNYGTFCTVKGPIATNYDKLQSYTPTCFY